MLSLLLRSFHQGLFNLTLYSDCLTDNLSIFFFCLSCSFKCIRICFSFDLCSLSLGIRNNSSFDKISFGNDFIVLDLSLGIHLIYQGNCPFFGFSCYSLALSTYLFNFLLLCGLLELSSFGLILTFLKSLLLQVLKGLCIILDTKFIGLLLSFQSILELENSLLLKRVSNISWQLHMSDDHRLDIDTLICHY
jgi:hypothetical protein